MEEFGSIEKVEALFAEKGLVSSGKYFIAYKDAAKSSGFVNGMEYPYTALLIKFTEQGLGVFYVNQPGVGLKLSLEKMNVNKASYFFIANEDIKEIKIKKYALLNSSTKRITIKLNDKKTHCLFAKLNEDALPYHADGLAAFMEKFGAQ